MMTLWGRPGSDCTITFAGSARTLKCEPTRNSGLSEGSVKRPLPTTLPVQRQVHAEPTRAHLGVQRETVGAALYVVLEG